MKMKKKYKILLIIIAVLLVILIGVGVYKFAFQKPEETKPEVTNITTVTNKIEGYDYTLDDRDTKLFEELFKELKENLESDNIDEEAYIQSISKLFIVDLYTISNKVSKYDIGGLEYLYSSAKESFRAKVLDTLYKSVEDNSYKTRNQELPTVQTIEVTKVEETTYPINKEKRNAYIVNLNWTYEESMGYDTKGTITLIEEENKWNIISYEATK